MVREPAADDRRQTAGFSIFVDQVIDERGARWETRLYHAESGAEATLAGVSPDEWIDWILDRAGPEHRRPSISARRGAVMEVASVQILDVQVSEPDGEPGSVHIVTAQVVVSLDGVAGVERHLGAELLRGLATHPADGTRTPQ